MLDKLLDKVLKGTNGYILGLGNIVLMLFLTLYLMIRFVVVWKVPPLTPYSLTLLGWDLVALALWVIVAHTVLGEKKIGRLLAGGFVVADVFFSCETYVLSWISKIAYWPIAHMNLKDLGVSDTSGYGTSIMAIVAILVFSALGFSLWQVFCSPEFWTKFYTWHLERFTNRSKAQQREQKLDLVVCIDKETRKPVVIPEGDLTTNISVEGPTGGGKTSMLLLPLVGQVLAIPRAGATVLEPKGSFAKKAYEMAIKSGNPYAKLINPEDPNTDIFNPMEGDDPDIVAAVNEAMLTAMFGKQEAFFHLNQAAIIKNLIVLLKYLRGNDLDYFDFDELLLDQTLCKNLVETLRNSLPDNEPLRSPRRRLVKWFDKEFFGENAEEIRKYSLGLRVQISNMLSNRYLTRCIIGKSTIDMDKLLADGGFLAVSTHDGLLKNLSKALGMVVLGHLQAAVERRPLPVNKSQPEFELRPHVIFIDELGTFANVEFGLFMTKVREYNSPLVLAWQQFSNLDAVDREFRKTVIGMCRSKIWFGDIPPEDAEWYSKLSGEYEEDDVSTSSGTSMGATAWFMPDSYREQESVRKVRKVKFTYTDILEAPAGTVFYRVMQNRTATPTNIGMVDWFTRKESAIGDAYWFDEDEFERRIEENRNGGKKEKGLLEKLRALFTNVQGINLRERLGLQRDEEPGNDESEIVETSSIMATAEEIMKKTVTGPPSLGVSDKSKTWIMKEKQAEDTENESVETDAEEVELIDQEGTSKSNAEIKENEELPPLKPVDKNQWASSADDLL